MTHVVVIESARLPVAFHPSRHDKLYYFYIVFIQFYSENTCPVSHATPTGAEALYELLQC